MLDILQKKLIKGPSCIICKSCLVSEKGIQFENKYFNNLSRGGLSIAILDSADERITVFDSVSTRNAAECVEELFSDCTFHM